MVLLAVCVVVTECGADRERQLIVDHQRAVYESLALQDVLQQHGGGHAVADLGIGISNQGMSKVLSMLKGLVISPAQPPKGYEDLSVRIKDVQLVSRAGGVNWNWNFPLSAPATIFSFRPR